MRPQVVLKAIVAVCAAAVIGTGCTASSRFQGDGYSIQIPESWEHRMTENPAGIPIDQLSDGRVGVAVIAGPVVPDEPLGAANAQEVSETWLNLEIEAGEPIDLPAGEAYRTLVSWPALPPGEKATVYAIQSSEKTYFFVFLDEPAHRQVMETVALDG